MSRPTSLRSAGFTHLLDWPVDDQPIWMRTRSGPLLSVPYPMELNDAGTLALRDHTGRQFADMIVDQFEELLEAVGKATARFRAVAARLHSSDSRSDCARCDQALKHCVEHKHADQIWFTRAGEICEVLLQHGGLGSSHGS